MRFVLASMALAIGALAGCADPLVCGADTLQKNGQCVPRSITECGGGTRLEGNACVPVSTVSCGADTIERDGACVPRTPLVCGPGTEALAGRCEVLDPLRRVTVPEGNEPNVPNGIPKRFTLPARGEPPAVLGGVIGLPQGGNPDLDGFLFTGAANQRIRLSGTAIGAPSIGVVVQSVDPKLVFTRFALALETRGAAREIIIPVDGDWLVIVSDQSNLTEGIPFGASDFTYTVDVEQVAPVAARPAPPGEELTGDHANLDRWGVTVAEDAPLYDIALAEPQDPGFPGQRALWATDAAGALIHNAVDELEYGYLWPMAPVRLGLPTGAVTFTVDYVYAIGKGPPYRLSLRPVPFVELGALPSPVDRRASLAEDGEDLYGVTVTAGMLLSAEIVPWSGSQLVPLVELRNRRWELVASVRGPRLAWYVPPGADGRYFVLAKDRTFSSTKTKLDYNLRAALRPVEPVGPVAAGDTVSVTGSFTGTDSQLLGVFAGNDASLTIKLKPESARDGRLVVWPTHQRTMIGESTAAPAGAVETVSDIVLPSGGLVIAEISADASGTFSLEASARETTVAFETEPNNDVGHANLLPLDAAWHAVVTGDVEPLGDADFFSFTVTGAPVTISGETSRGPHGGTTDTRLSILNAGGSLVVTNDDIATDARFSRLTTTLQPGAYYFRVMRGFSTAAPWDAFDYTLTVASAIP